MTGLATFMDRPREAALAVLFVAMATIAAVLVLQHGLGYEPCPLCLQQRIPYYIAMPIALITAFLAAAGHAHFARLGLAALALVFLVSAGLGVYHAGVEWRLWEGPAACAVAGNTSGSHETFLGRLQGVQVVSCTDAAFRVLGLSLAGWNVLVSGALALLAGIAATRALKSSEWRMANGE